MAKQLSLPERIVIEQMIHKDFSFASIGRNLDRSASTIAREVLHYRYFTNRIPLMGENDCIFRPSCQKNALCPEVSVHGCFGSRCKRCPDGIICTSISTYPKKLFIGNGRTKKVLTKLEYQYRQGRTIEDFTFNIEANPDLSIVEMDTVKGGREKRKVLLTMIFRKANFMLIFLMTDGIQESVIHVFDAITELLGMALFKRLFPVTLTDNGVEFKNPNALEHTRNGLIRSHVFFCDPQGPWQKPLVENNHRLIRRILPNGAGFNKLSVGDVSLICCHINSVLREQLSGKTPFGLMNSADEKNYYLHLTCRPFHLMRLF